MRPPRDSEHERADAEHLRRRRGERAEQSSDRQPRTHREHHDSRVDTLGERHEPYPRAEYDECGRG
jgi:hypothetical protein